MKSHIPSSLFAATISSLAIVGVFVGVNAFLGNLEPGQLLVECVILAVTTMVAIAATLEFFIFRRMKNVTAARTAEIEKLKEMEAFRREFLGDVSHELKTPIFAIEGFVETLLDGALEDPKVNKKFLQKTRKHAERLSHLVSDILIISQIESGDLGMNDEHFSIHELVMDVLDSLAYKFTKKGRDISYKVLANGHEHTLVEADKQRIDQVVRNLIDNAVKYGDSKGVVTISIERSTEEEGKLIVKVNDNGPGIDKQHIPRLFERFYRVDKSRSREKGGTGLGLAICKHLIEAHGERIWVETEPGKGATFMFTLKKAG
jgi:two-component system phosphate regulon sensor histidine kinase PhoR